MTIEQYIADVCAKHDLARVDLGSYADGDYIVTVWWDGFSVRNCPCAYGHGETMVEALASALKCAQSDRTPPAPEVEPMAFDMPEPPLAA